MQLAIFNTFRLFYYLINFSKCIFSYIRIDFANSALSDASKGRFQHLWSSRWFHGEKPNKIHHTSLAVLADIPTHRVTSCYSLSQHASSRKRPSSAKTVSHTTKTWLAKLKKNVCLLQRCFPNSKIVYRILSFSKKFKINTFFIFLAAKYFWFLSLCS